MSSDGQEIKCDLQEQMWDAKQNYRSVYKNEDDRSS